MASSCDFHLNVERILEYQNLVITTAGEAPKPDIILSIFNSGENEIRVMASQISPLNLGGIQMPELVQGFTPANGEKESRGRPMR